MTTPPNPTPEPTPAPAPTPDPAPAPPAPVKPPESRPGPDVAGTLAEVKSAIEGIPDAVSKLIAAHGTPEPAPAPPPVQEPPQPTAKPTPDGPKPVETPPAAEAGTRGAGGRFSRWFYGD